MSTETTAATPATPKPSVADEFLAAFRAEPKPVASAEAASEAPAEPAKPVEATAEGETTEEVTAEPAKPVEKPTSLARRLALVAQAERARKTKEAADADAAAKLAAREKEIAPIIDRITKAKTAGSKMEAAATVLGLDDDGIAELYLELHKHHAEGGEKKADPMANLEATVAKLLDQKLTERDAARKANEEKALNEHREAYTTEALGVLDARGDEFPLVAIAPPSQVDITAISEAWLTANGEIPEPEMVLKLIQDQRQKALDERNARKARPAEKKTGGTTAPAPAGENSGSKVKPARTDSALSPPRKLSVADEFLEAYRAASRSA